MSIKCVCIKQIEIFAVNVMCDGGVTFYLTGARGRGRGINYWRGEGSREEGERFMTRKVFIFMCKEKVIIFN